MAERRTRAAAGDDDDVSKAQLQKRIEETRESISQTVEEIKETVSDQYEAVKETVADVIGWNEEFSKNPVVWGLGAMSVGLIIGYSIAVVRQDGGKPSRKRKDSSADNFFDSLSRVGTTFVLPAVANKIRDVFGVDLSQQLLGLTSGEPERKGARSRKRSTTKRGAKKAVSKRRTTKKRGAKSLKGAE